jgi:hypothetical protein
MTQVADRSFRLVGIVLLFAALASTAPTAAQNTNPTPIKLGDLPLLFADDSAIAAQEGVKRTIHPGQTSTEPVLSPDRPWEGCRVYATGAVYFDESQRLFRLWYGGGGLLYATSPDGAHWDKPALDIYPYKGSKTTNIAFRGFACPSVLLDRRETDPAKRYKMVGSRVTKGYHSAYSPDGLHWTEIKQPIFMYHDTITLAQDPRSGDYLAYHKRHWDHRGFNRRTVWLSRSHDFQTWGEPHFVFAPDEEDDAWATMPPQRTEVYNMAVLTHASGFLGFPTMFRVTNLIDKETVKPQQSPVDGSINVQLVTSTDGEAWQRTSPRVVVIPNGPSGSFDAGCILNVSSTAAHTDKQTWLYYTGVNTTHGGTLPPKRMCLGRAVWRRHGFASLDATGDARIETQPLQLASPSLLVNADARNGRLRVAVLEADGRPVSGLSLDDCEPLTDDSTQHTLRWKSNQQPPTDRPVRLVIAMTAARLFSLESR